MTTAILAAIIPLSVNFLLAAAVFRLPELQVAGVDGEEAEVAGELTKEAA